MNRNRTARPAVPAPAPTGTALAIPASAALSAEEILRRRIAQLESELTQARLAEPARVPRAKTARDWTRDVDLAIIAAAGQLVEELVPEALRPTVRRNIANQLHHLSTPALGWPSMTLPKPERSDWR